MSQFPPYHFPSEQVKALFLLAGFQVLALEALTDRYGYTPDHPDYYKEPPRTCWWLVQTEMGWIKIGHRKRVMEIDWRYTGFPVHITSDNVTKTEYLVHAYSKEDALKYLSALYKARYSKEETR